MKPSSKLLPILLLAFAASASPSFAGDDQTAAQLTDLASHLDTAASRLAASDRPGAQSAYKIFDDGWANVEDSVREKSKAHYRAIEDAMGDVRYLFDAEPFDSGKAKAAIEELRARADGFIKGEPAPSSQAAAEHGKVTVSSLVARLERAEVALDSGDATAATAKIAAFRREWTEIEAFVKAHSPQVYSATENNIAKAYALLTRNPPEVSAARLTLARMKTDLEPFAQGAARYGIFDAALILLREGSEAILVVAALLAFLSQTQHADKRPWIWGGKIGRASCRERV